MQANSEQIIKLASKTLIGFTPEYSQNINFTSVVDCNIDNKYLFSNVLFKYCNLVQVLNQHWRFDRHIFNIMPMYNQILWKHLYCFQNVTRAQ